MSTNTDMPDEPKRRPAVVSPHATASEAYAFLTDFLLALSDHLTLEDAQMQAHKMLGVDGKALYDKPEREFKDCFGEAGVQIWRELYESAYGYAGSCWIFVDKIGVVLGLATFGSGIYQPFKEKDERSLTATLVLLCTCIVILCCRESARSGFVKNSSRFPEILKLRGADLWAMRL